MQRGQFVLPDTCKRNGLYVYRPEGLTLARPTTAPRKTDRAKAVISGTFMELVCWVNYVAVLSLFVWYACQYISNFCLVDFRMFVDVCPYFVCFGENVLVSNLVCPGLRTLVFFSLILRC